MAIDDNTSYELTGAQVKDLASKINAKVDSADLAAVAESGDYTDLINTPTIPTVNDATLTIQHNGTNVQTFTANASSNATANIETIYADTIAPATAVAPITTDMIGDGAVTSAKMNMQSMWGGLSGGYTGGTSGLYAKIMRLDFSASWKNVIIRFTFGSSQSDTFAYDVMLRIARGSGVVRSVNLTAWTLQTTAHDLASRLKVVALSADQYELYWQTDATGSAMANVYSFLTWDHSADTYGKLTLYIDSTSSALPSGTTYACTVKNNLIS